MGAKDRERGRPANLFVLTEAFCQVRTEVDWLRSGILFLMGLPVLTTYEIQEARRLQCGTGSQWTHQCLYESWIRALGSELREEQSGALGRQYGEVAVLAGMSDFELASAEVVEEAICPGIGGALKKTLVGLRLRIKETGDVLPVYAAHLVAGPAWRQRRCVGDLVESVKRHWVRGDLTPLVVGDFNFTSNAQESYGRMADHFTETLRSVSGHDGIEHAWVGEPTSPHFPDNAGALVPLRGTWDQGEEFNYRKDGEERLTDHDVPFIELGLAHDPGSSSLHTGGCRR